MSYLRHAFCLGLVALLSLSMATPFANAQYIVTNVPPTSAPPGMGPSFQMTLPGNGAPNTAPNTPPYPDVASALARANSAQQSYNDALAKLKQVTLNIRAKYDSAPETVRARAELDDATRDLNTIRKTATHSLESNQDYIQLQLEIDHVSKVLDNDEDSLSLPQVDRDGLAQAKLDYATRLHHMEEDALNQSGDYQSALDRLDKASVHWTTVQAQLAAAMKNDPDLAKAQADVTKAQADLTTAQAYLHGAMVERQDADQAAYLRYLNGDNSNGQGMYFDYNGYPFYGRYPPYQIYSAPAVVTQPPPPTNGR